MSTSKTGKERGEQNRAGAAGEKILCLERGADLGRAERAVAPESVELAERRSGIDPAGRRMENMKHRLRCRLLAKVMKEASTNGFVRGRGKGRNPLLLEGFDFGEDGASRQEEIEWLRKVRHGPAIGPLEERRR